MRHVRVSAGLICGLLLAAPAAASAEAGGSTIDPPNQRWSFHAQQIGTTQSHALTLTVRCSSEDGDPADPCDVPETVNSIALDDFGDSTYTLTDNTCPATPFTVDSPTPLTCSFKVSYTAGGGGGGWEGAILTIDTVQQPDLWVDFSAYGTEMGPPTLDPSSLSFGDQAVGSTSTAQEVEFSASCSVWSGDGYPDGTGVVCEGPPEITAIDLPAGYAQSNDCPTGSSTGIRCTIEVAFSPAAAGPTPGALLSVTVEDPQFLHHGTYTIPLSGTGVPPDPDPPAGVGSPPGTAPGVPAKKAKKCKKKKRRSASAAAKRCGKKRNRSTPVEPGIRGG